MKLYLLSQSVNNDYDTYDSFVICCNNEDEARQSHPSGRVLNPRDDFLYCDWTNNQENISVKYLGEADPDLPFGIVCSSFNAG